MDDDIETRYYTERVLFIAKRGTKKKLLSYITQYPNIWAHQSHFIRCAIENYIDEQKSRGRHITNETEAIE